MMANRITCTLIVCGVVAIASCGRGTDTPDSRKAPSTEASPAPAGSAPAAGAAGEAKPAGDVPLDLTGTVASHRVDVQGLADCTYTTDAALYDVPATMWHVTWRSDGTPGLSYANLTVWQFKNGDPDQLTVGLQMGPDFHHLSTVKASPTAGKGTVHAERSGAAGTVTVEGEDAKGIPISLVFKCARFTMPVEEGGR
jgi:hypothetical protein